MKRYFIPLLISFTFLSCKNSETPETPIAETTVDTIAKEKPNELYGTVFREISEISQFKDYTDIGGKVLGNSTPEGDFKYAIGQYTNDKSNLIVLEEIVKEANNPKSKYKILDILNIPQLNIDEVLVLYSCSINNVQDSDIIAVAKSLNSDDQENYTEIVKAWRIDIGTKKIIPIADVTGIECFNESYAAE